jgi:hypothetical protein
MLCARATLTAGPRHKRYKAGTAVHAVVFAKDAKHPDDLQGDHFKGLAVRGWQRMTIQGHKLLPEDHDISASDSVEAEAFRHALETGYGIAVLGLVQ